MEIYLLDKMQLFLWIPARWLAGDPALRGAFSRLTLPSEGPRQMVFITDCTNWRGYFELLLINKQAAVARGKRSQPINLRLEVQSSVHMSNCP